MTSRAALGDVIREQRDLRGLSTRALCESCGLSKAYLVQIEKGRKHNLGLGTLDRIAAVLGVETWALLKIAREREGGGGQ